MGEVGAAEAAAERTAAEASSVFEEPELSWPPPAVPSVDADEVPEVATFFFARRSALYRFGAVLFVLLVVTSVGMASAIADAYFIPIGAEPAAGP